MILRSQNQQNVFAMETFYSDGQVYLYQSDVLDWALDYKARIDAGEVLTPRQK